VRDASTLAARSLPTGTVTFLFTDVEGSTRLLDELGPERYAEALAEHRRVLRNAFAAHRGVEVDTQGDAFFVAFHSAAEAIAAARDAQAALTSAVAVRMGLYTGEPLLAEGGYVGMDVHRGARIAAAGHGRQVLVSEATRDALVTETVPATELRDLGEQRLKDLGTPIRLYQLGAGDFPPLKVLYRSTLPVQRSPLVGRDRELAEAAALLRGYRVVTLTGPGGSGKTRLALQLAAEVTEDFPDGVYWVALQAVRDPALVPPTIAQALDAKGDLVEHIADGRILLLLDNLEQLVDCAPALANLLALTPKLKLLATSREPLHIDGERTYPVDPLLIEDAVALFAQRAAVIEPSDVVAAICQRLDCLPLAVELAAARTTLLSPERLLGRLDQALPILTSGRRDAPERQRTMRATIAWSYELLQTEEQTLFRRLAVFAGSFDVSAAEMVCDADVDPLQSLLEKSLLRRWESGRFAMLETIHEHALECLNAQDATADDIAALRRRHAYYYLALAEQAEPELRGPEQRAWRARLELEHDNLRAAVAWSREDGDTDLGLRLAGALWRFWRTNNHLDEGTRLLDALLGLADSAPGLRARALLGASRLAMDQGDGERSISAAEEALAAAQAGGKPTQVAAVTENLGLMMLTKELRAGSERSPERLNRAIALLEEGVTRYRELGDRVGTADALNNLGNALLELGKTARAAEVLEEGLVLQRDAGNALGLAFVLNTLGYLAVHEGELELANTRLTESLSLFYELGDLARVGDSLEGFAQIAAGRGNDRRAVVLWAAGESLRVKAGKEMEPSERALHDVALAPVRARLGEAAVALAWGDGAGLDPEDAVALAFSSSEQASVGARDEAASLD
jgi:predicted ATPase/class 3 adenylate cyclase